MSQIRAGLVAKSAGLAIGTGGALLPGMTDHISDKQQHDLDSDDSEDDRIPRISGPICRHCGCDIKTGTVCPCEVLGYGVRFGIDS